MGLRGGKDKSMQFLGRVQEKALLRSWANETNGSYLSVIYGRRRIGKTRLVEESFKDATLFKFEGLEGQPTNEQQRQFLARLAELSGKPEYRLIKTSRWTDILIILSNYLSEYASNKKPVVVFFDEFQWMASGRTKLVSNLKYVWDNYFMKNNRVHLILCGSACSFLVKKVIRSKALYGRINLEINVKQLQLPEIKNVFQPKRSLWDVVELYMALGGVPQYLEMVDPSRSVRANLERLCFLRNGYLVNEFERIFASHFGTNQHYRRILMHLARNSFASREKLQVVCNLASGGRVTGYLQDLEMAGLVERYTPVDKPRATRVNRYRIVDPYLLFYFRFIQPSLRKIRESTAEPVFSRFVPDRKHDVWRGLAFELVCFQHSHIVAEKLGFSAVNYECGSWFSQAPGQARHQIDLLFVRADRVITLCEIKFQDKKIGKGIIAEVEKKRQGLANPKRFTVETVLVTASDVTEDLKKEKYFNQIVQLEDLFGA